MFVKGLEGVEFGFIVLGRGRRFFIRFVLGLGCVVSVYVVFFIF